VKPGLLRTIRSNEMRSAGSARRGGKQGAERKRRNERRELLRLQTASQTIPLNRAGTYGFVSRQVQRNMIRKSDANDDKTGDGKRGLGFERQGTNTAVINN